MRIKLLWLHAWNVLSTFSLKFNHLDMIKLFEIVLTILIVLIPILNGHDCLFSMCFGICYMSCIYFIHWVYYHFVFSKKFQKLDSDLNECFQKLEVILDSVKYREETKKNFLKITTYHYLLTIFTWKVNYTIYWGIHRNISLTRR